MSFLILRWISASCHVYECHSVSLSGGGHRGNQLAYNYKTNNPTLPSFSLLAAQKSREFDPLLIFGTASKGWLARRRSGNEVLHKVKLTQPQVSCE